jgi:hypothetical protein
MRVIAMFRQFPRSSTILVGMALKLIIRAAASLLLLAGIGICWFVVAFDYSDAAASGTYRLAYKGMRSTLVLRPNHSFGQEVSDPSGIQRAEGTWRRVGEGGVALSQDFLTLPGEQRGEDGTAYSDMQRKFGILIRLSPRTYQVVWYGRTEPATTDQVVGRYQETEGTHSRTLVLNSDQTFEQTVAGWMQTASAKGTWNVASNGNVMFSREFLKPSGQPLANGETATAMDARGSRFLQIEIAADQKLGVLSYYKEQLPWQ